MGPRSLFLELFSNGQLQQQRPSMLSVISPWSNYIRRFPIFDNNSIAGIFRSIRAWLNWILLGTLLCVTLLRASNIVMSDTKGTSSSDN